MTVRVLVLAPMVLLVACAAAVTPPSAPRVDPSAGTRSPSPAPVASPRSPVTGPTRPLASSGARAFDRACDGSRSYDALPVPLVSSQIRCVQREQAGAAGEIHRFYTLTDGRTFYVFEALTAPDPKTRNATERVDGSFDLAGQPFTWRLLTGSSGQKWFPPELYVAGAVHGVHLELVLQVRAAEGQLPSIEAQTKVLDELKGFVRSAIEAR